MLDSIFPKIIMLFTATVLLFPIIISALSSFFFNYRLNLIFTKKQKQQKDSDYFIQKLEELNSFCYDYWYENQTKHKNLLAYRIISGILLLKILLEDFNKKYKFRESDKGYKKIRLQIINLQKIAPSRNFRNDKRDVENYIDILVNINIIHKNILGLF